MTKGMFNRIARLLCALAVSACNTVQGVGQDITESSEAVEDAMND